MGIVDDIKARIADLKVKKEAVKTASEAEILKINNKIAELQAIQQQITSSLETSISTLRKDGLL